ASTGFTQALPPMFVAGALLEPLQVRLGPRLQTTIPTSSQSVTRSPRSHRWSSSRASRTSSRQFTARCITSERVMPYSFAYVCNASATSGRWLRLTDQTVLLEDMGNLLCCRLELGIEKAPALERDRGNLR